MTFYSIYEIYISTNFLYFKKKKKVQVHKAQMTTFGSSAVPCDSLSFG